MVTTQNIINYLKNNYLTIEQLADKANASLEQLNAYITHSCIPKHSHTVHHQTISHTDIFGDTIISKHSVFYYHPSLIQWAIKANTYSKTINFTDIATKIKMDFIQELRQTLTEIDEAKQVFSYCFSEDGTLLESGIQRIMMEHWGFVIDGTYGVCLKDISARTIIIKSIAVSILEQWVKSNDNDKKYLYHKTSHAAELYGSVAACFGPHEIHKSTRGRLFNQFKQFVYNS